jgi:hypothetical protein
MLQKREVVQATWMFEQCDYKFSNETLLGIMFFNNEV